MSSKPTWPSGVNAATGIWVTAHTPIVCGTALPLTTGLIRQGCCLKALVPSFISPPQCFKKCKPQIVQRTLRAPISFPGNTLLRLYLFYFERRETLWVSWSCRGPGFDSLVPRTHMGWFTPVTGNMPHSSDLCM